MHVESYKVCVNDFLNILADINISGTRSSINTIALEVKVDGAFYHIVGPIS